MPTITRLPGPLGAEITDLNLSRPVDSETFAVIEHALHEHGVLCIRGQTNLSPEQHIAFSRRLGELEVHVQASFLLPGYPELYCISQYCGQNLGRLFGNNTIVAKGFVLRAGFFQTQPVS